MKFSIAFTILFYYSALCSVTAQAPDKCGTSSYQALNDQRFNGYKEAREKIEDHIHQQKTKRTTITGVVRLPVVVHVIYSTSQSNISEERIIAQIRILNEDYRRKNADTLKTPAEFRPVSTDTQIEFCLATRDPQGNVTNGIIRKKTDKINFRGYEDDQEDRDLKALSYWPSDQYLNIWVTTLFDNVLGYSWYPESNLFPDLAEQWEANLDGVVIHYSAFGGSTNSKFKYNKGRTTTHEVGHWLGLKHIWGDGVCGDDYISDTPLQRWNNLALEIDGNCTNYSDCLGSQTRDMSANYMDYSPDICMNIFTKGQAQRMQAVLESNTRRIAIQESPGCCNPVNVAQLPFFQGFENNDFLSEGWSISSNSVDSRWKRAASGTKGPSSYGLNVQTTETSTTHIHTLASVPLDFMKQTRPQLSFSIAQAASPGLIDSLVVSYNPNCKYIIPIVTFYPDQLTTSNPSVPFTPGISQWKKYLVDLQPLAGKKIAQIIFTVYSQNQGTIYLDDINIYNSQKLFTLDIYPNPANEHLTATIGALEPGPITFVMYNAVGQEIRTWRNEEQNLKKDIVIDDLSPGLYLLKAVSTNQSAVKRFLIEK